MLALFVKLVV
jgi:hypothetical protein